MAAAERGRPGRGGPAVVTSVVRTVDALDATPSGQSVRHHLHRPVGYAVFAMALGSAPARCWAYPPALAVTLAGFAGLGR